MKNLIPLLIATMLIGAGCALEPTVPPRAVPEEVRVETQTVRGVVEAYDADRGIVSLRTATGSTEEVLWPVGGQDPVTLTGSVVDADGERDRSTLALVASAVRPVTIERVAVSSPELGATVTSPIVVSGFGRAFEQTFAWRVRDAAGAVRAEGSAMTDARETGWFGPFTFEVFLPAMEGTAFTLEVLEYSAKDGSEQGLVSIPLRLLSDKTSTFSIYFQNPMLGSATDCAAVFPVTRTMSQTAAIGRASLAELLRGPTEAERAQGFSSAIPYGAALRSLVIGGRVAKADFSRAIEPGGGSCLVTAIRSQIEQTIGQFETVDEVVISVEGEVETALQP